MARIAWAKLSTAWCGAVEDFGEEPPLLRSEPPHNAEIDRDEPAGIVDEQVARMHVGVEEAVAQRMAQERLQQSAPEMFEVEARGHEARAVGQRRGADPFEGEHVLGGAVPVDRRDAEIRIVPGVVRHLGDRRGLEAEIHFDRDRTREGIDHLVEPQAPRLGRKSFRLTGGKKEGIEIGPEAALDAGPQHFDRDRAPALRRFDLGTMHLGDRGGGVRRPEAREQFIERLAERARNRRLGIGLRERRHLVLQAFEVARERRPDHVGPRRQELAELDIGRPELGERGGEAHGRALAGRPFDQARAGERRACRQRQWFGIDQRQHSLAREYEAGAAEAGEMSEGGDHEESCRAGQRVTAASPNGWRRCRRSSAGTRRAESPPRAASSRTLPAWETGGSTRRDSDKARHRPPPPGRAPERG